MREWLSDFLWDYPLLIVGAILLTCFTAIGFISCAEIRETDRLMKQCMADGHKEYECVGILQLNSRKTETVPIYIER